MRKVLFILGQLSDDDVTWLAEAGKRERVASGTVLIREGEPLSSLYILLDGHLVVSVEGLGEVARLGSGEIVGEMSFVESSPPAASVTALDGSLVLRVPSRVLQDKIDADPLFGRRFYKALAIFLSARLRGTVKRLGFGETGELDDSREMDNELDLGVLDRLHLAGARFDRLLKRLSDG